MEWHSRKMSIEIHGIMSTEYENLFLEINEVGKTLDVPEQAESDAVALHRLPLKPDKVPGTIVPFAAHKTRDTWIENWNVPRRVSHKSSLKENMTKRNRALLWKASEWARERQYHFVWQKDKIFLRKENMRLGFSNSLGLTRL